MNYQHLGYLVLLLPLLGQPVSAQTGGRVSPAIENTALAQPGDKEQPKQPANDKDRVTRRELLKATTAGCVFVRVMGHTSC